MADEKLTYCVARGAHLWAQDDGKWRLAYKATPKTACGRLVRVTAIKGSDVRSTQPLAVLRVRGNIIGAHPKDIKLVGRG